MSTGGRLPVGADMLDIRSERSRPHRIGRPACALNRPTWSPVKAVPLAFPPSAQVLLSDNDFSGSATDTDIILAPHFWTGGLETAGPGCHDAVAIARTAGFRMRVMSPHPSCGDCPLTARSRPKRTAKISRKIVVGQQYLSGWGKRERNCPLSGIRSSA